MNKGTGLQDGKNEQGDLLTPAFPPKASSPGTVAPTKHPEDRLGHVIPESMTGRCQLQKSTLMQSMATTKLFFTGGISVLASGQPLFIPYAMFLPALKSIGMNSVPRAGPTPPPLSILTEFV